jgi:hypothetical protein
MANTFNRKLSRNVGTSLTAVGSYTVGSSTKTVIVGLTLANVSGSSINVDATVNDGSNDYYIIKNAPIAAGGSLVVVGGDQKIVLNTSDSIKVKSDTASSLDAILSIMEIT